MPIPLEVGILLLPNSGCPYTDPRCSNLLTPPGYGSDPADLPTVARVAESCGGLLLVLTLAFALAAAAGWRRRRQMAFAITSAALAGLSLLVGEHAWQTYASSGTYYTVWAGFPIVDVYKGLVGLVFLGATALCATAILQTKAMFRSRRRSSQVAGTRPKV